MTRKLSEITSEELERLEVFRGKVLQNVVLNSTIGPQLRSVGTTILKMKKLRTETQVIADFWARVRMGEVTECWLWQGSLKGSRGKHYGGFYIGNKHYGSHQFAAIQFHGPRPPKSHVCHKCDNPSCCNPLHLYFGTAFENVEDAIVRGRRKYIMGSKHYISKLTEDQVLQLKIEIPNRPYGWRKQKIKELGVTGNVIDQIIAGKTWKHVKAPELLMGKFYHSQP